MREWDAGTDRTAEEAGAWSCLEAGEDCYAEYDALTEDEALFG
jgi:hypothetical protein